MLRAVMNEMFDSSAEIENAGVDFNMLCYPEENINTCNTSDESEWENSEAVAQRYSVLKVLWEILKNSEEDTCARVSF